MNPTFEAYRAVLADLSALPHPPILIGRMAMVCFGSDQLTRDMDLVTPDFPEVVETLYRDGFRMVSEKSVGPDGGATFRLYETSAQARYAIGLRDKKSFRTMNPETRAELDIWLDPRVPYAELRRDAREVDLGGIRILVPSAQNMIRLKEFALADDPSRAPKDRWDIDFLRREGR